MGEWQVEKLLEWGAGFFWGCFCTIGFLYLRRKLN